MRNPKITNPNDLIIKPTTLDEDKLKTTTDHFLSQSTLGAFNVKTLNHAGLISNEYISVEYAKQALERSFKQLKDGDVSILEEVLLSQAIALNIAFSSLSVRAASQKDASTIQMFMNLCFKAQNQSRATIETLIHLKQPSSTQFIKQTNIAQGHQQVNNLAEKNVTPQNELIGKSDENPQLDNRAAPTSKRINSKLETLDKINRSKDARGKS